MRNNYMCNKCFSIHEKRDVCKACGNKSLFSVDPLMIPVLKLFNENGLKTLFHCEGHYKSELSIDAYVSIDYSDISHQFLINRLDKLYNAKWTYELRPSINESRWFPRIILRIEYPLSCQNDESEFEKHKKTAVDSLIKIIRS
jgi:hypothetical protein